MKGTNNVFADCIQTQINLDKKNVMDFTECEPKSSSWCGTIGMIKSLFANFGMKWFCSGEIKMNDWHRNAKQIKKANIKWKINVDWCIIY